MALKTYKLRVHKDKRGTLLTTASKIIGKQIQHFFIATLEPGITRGNHYHLHKKEWFILLNGKAKLSFEDLKSKKQKSYIHARSPQGANCAFRRSELIIDSKDHLIYEMKPNFAHAIKNISSSPIILVALVNEPFNKKNPDTFHHEITAQ